MKKYSANFFEKKYRILFNKLYTKTNFSDAVKKTRIRLGIPEGGFSKETDLAIYLLGQMDRKNQLLIWLIAFAPEYFAKDKLTPDKDEAWEKMVHAFEKEKDDVLAVKAVLWVGQEILDHNTMLTQHPMLRKNKLLSLLFPETIKLIRQFWALDLLDEHIIGHLVEKYLFLGDYGVNKYIEQKVMCPSCRYIGVHHFSPERNHMRGQKEGAYGKNYVFNKETVKRLSLHFNSVFLIIKPYATKDEVLQYIEDNWNNLKKHIIEKNSFYKQFDVHPSKIKQSNFERNRLVYELYKLPKKEILGMYKGQADFYGSDVYKETIISAILHEQYGVSMTADAIKKSATRFAKSAEVRKEPKDIRDI